MTQIFLAQPAKPAIPILATPNFVMEVARRPQDRQVAERRAARDA